MEELRLLDLLATPERPRVRNLEYDDLGKLHYLSCAIKVRSSWFEPYIPLAAGEQSR